jgi:hypothetical protein
MRNLTLVAMLVSISSLHLGCSSNDVGSPPAGEGGAAGGARDASSTGGGAGSGTAGVGGKGTGGTGGAEGGMEAGMAGTANGGSGGTPVVDPCEGMYKPLPFVVSSGFTNLQFCGNGTCSAGVSNFTRIESPDCDETYPEGGIVPIPSELDSGSDAAATDQDAGEASTGSAEASANGGDATTDALQVLPLADATITEASADSGSDATNDTTVAISADASRDGGVTDAAAEASPPGPPPACYKFLYDPACATAPLCWGGVIFTQAPAGKDTAGICIQEGATKITFKAKASRPDARVKFGSIREGTGATEFFLNLTTEWAAYEISIPANEPYNSYTSAGVWNGFSVILEPLDHAGGTYLFVKDAVWSKN